MRAECFNQRYGTLMRGKLGLRTEEEADLELLAELFEMMERGRVDYTRFFRTLSTFPDASGLFSEALVGLGLDRERLDHWLARYGARLERDGGSEVERRERMNRVNPKYILRNYLAQQAIERAREADFTEIERLCAVLRDPFSEQPELERYADPPPPWAREIVVSCSS